MKSIRSCGNAASCISAIILCVAGCTSTPVVPVKDQDTLLKNFEQLGTYKTGGESKGKAYKSANPTAKAGDKCADTYAEAAKASKVQSDTIYNAIVNHLPLSGVSADNYGKAYAALMTCDQPSVASGGSDPVLVATAIFTIISKGVEAYQNRQDVLDKAALATLKNSLDGYIWSSYETL